MRAIDSRSFGGCAIGLGAVSGVPLSLPILLAILIPNALLEKSTGSTRSLSLKPSLISLNFSSRFRCSLLLIRFEGLEGVEELVKAVLRVEGVEGVLE